MYCACVSLRSCLIYGSVTWLVKVEQASSDGYVDVLGKKETKVQKSKNCSDEFGDQQGRLRWFSHVVMTLIVQKVVQQWRQKELNGSEEQNRRLEEQKGWTEQLVSAEVMHRSGTDGGSKITCKMAVKSAYFYVFSVEADALVERLSCAIMDLGMQVVYALMCWFVTYSYSSTNV